MTILLLVDFYRPGFRAGGPIQSVFNLVQQFNGEHDFCIITRNHDEKVTEPYALPSDTWITRDGAKVYYVSSVSAQSIRTAVRSMQTPPDLVWANSFFSRFTVGYLVLRRLGLVSRRLPVLISPRNELSKEALSFRQMKKTLYRSMAKTVGLYAGCAFHATSAGEGEDIGQVYGSAYVAPNLMAVPAAQLLDSLVTKRPGELRLLFLSRIDGMKNLPFLLDVLADLEQEPESTGIHFDIAGPVKDSVLWASCQPKIASLKKITVNYVGPIERSRISEVQRGAHFYILPTFGENFGFGIVEAWSSGLPTIISQNTPWTGLQSKGVGWDLPLDPETWKRTLREALAMREDEWLRMRHAAFDLYAEVAKDPGPKNAIRHMLASVSQRSVQLQPA